MNYITPKLVRRQRGWLCSLGLQQKPWAGIQRLFFAKEVFNKLLIHTVMRRESASRLFRLGLKFINVENPGAFETLTLGKHQHLHCFRSESSPLAFERCNFSSLVFGTRSYTSQLTSVSNVAAACFPRSSLVACRQFSLFSRQLHGSTGIHSYFNTANLSLRFHHRWKLAAQAVRPSVERILRIGEGYNARLFTINALYAAQTSSHWTRLLSLLLAEAVTRGDPLAWCYDVPVTEKEIEMLQVADSSNIEAARVLAQSLWRKLLRFLGSAVRLVVLLLLFSPAICSAPLALQHEGTRRQWFRMLRRTLEIAGPAFIKWGQWAATRADLFPPDLCAELAKLHSSAPAHEFMRTETAIEQEFGFSLLELFNEFDLDPVASGSIGQIHRASLSSVGARLTGVKEGTVVAVKVRHPGVTETIERDFALMMAVAHMADWIPSLRSFRLSESLEQFAAPLREQVDLTREAYNLHAFNYNFRSENRVSFPVPLYPLVSPSVLVETFEGGRHISEYVARGAGAPFNSDLARIGARTMLHMFIVDNLVHADLHPGNILVRLTPHGGSIGGRLLHQLQRTVSFLNSRFNLSLTVPDDIVFKPSIVLLDAGMATRLSPEDQLSMVGLFDSFSRLDGRGVADWALRFAGERQTCPDPASFRRAMEEHFEALHEADGSEAVDTSSGAEILASVLETVRQHEVMLPGHICAAVVTTLVLEGWSHKLDPEHSTLSEVKRVIALKKNETKMRRVAQWVQGAAVDREIYEHMPAFAPDGGLVRHVLNKKHKGHHRHHHRERGWEGR